MYRVGALANAYRAYRYLTLPAARFTAQNITPPGWRDRLSRAGYEISSIARTIRRHIRNRQWRDLKNNFNGWLAEPTPWPEGTGLTSCGRGWTRRAALYSLAKRVRAAEERHSDPAHLAILTQILKEHAR